MSSTVQIVRVVVASPSDVAVERELVEQVINDLNHTTALDRALRLEVARWETDAYPGFHINGPQGICDAVLDIVDCNILVGIFWTRFGTPTKAGETGTEHEINIALSAWQQQARPHVMLFFNNAPPKLKSAAERRQWASVAEYREKLSREGLVWEYEGIADFERAFRRSLENYLRGAFSVSTRAIKSSRGAQFEHSEQFRLVSGVPECSDIQVNVSPRVGPDKVDILLRALATLYRESEGVSIQISIGSHKREDNKNV